MDLKDRIKTKSFWISILSAVVLILAGFGVKFNMPAIDEAINAVCAVLIFLGILTEHPHDSKENLENTDITDNPELTNNSDNQDLGNLDDIEKS